MWILSSWTEVVLYTFSCLPTTCNVQMKRIPASPSNTGVTNTMVLLAIAGAGLVGLVVFSLSMIAYGPKKSVKLIGGEWNTRVDLIRTYETCEDVQRKRETAGGKTETYTETVCSTHRKTVDKLEKTGRCDVRHCVDIERPIIPENWVKRTRFNNELDVEHTENFRLIFHNIEKPESKHYKLSYSEYDYNLGTRRLIGKWYKMQCQVIGCTSPDLLAALTSYSSNPQASHE